MTKDTPDQELLAALGSSLLEYGREVAGRLHTRRQMEVFELSAEAELSAPVPPGTILAVIGSADSPELAALGSAVETRDTEALDRALTALAEQSRTTAPTGGLGAVPVLSDVDYRGKPIVMGLPLAGPDDVAVASFVFAGGSFDREGFGVTHLTTPDGQALADRLRGVLIARQPRLSPTERALLDRLPELDLNAAVAPPHLATVFVVAVTLTSGAYPFQDGALSESIRTHFPQLEWPPPDPPVTDPRTTQDRLRAWLESPERARELEALDARAAVEELVRVRQRILTGSL
jgi:hypothetical protein